VNAASSLAHSTDALMNLDDCLARACAEVPGLYQAALALLPEGLLLAGVGPGGLFEREPLVRAATRCLVVPAGRDGEAPASSRLVEHVLVSEEEVVILSRGREHPRLALALACGTEPNLAFLIVAFRAALRRLEANVDLAELGLA
jgi:hypothetical protein